MVSSIPNTNNFQSVDGTLKSIYSPVQSGPGSNSNEEMLFTLLTSRTGASQLDAV